ncbi:DUF167 domain-containing protein [Seleniivibrio woodruffii]|uniref:DUF167 domain-containing protein n=1 Tax=Seleniivibrio woodruffii TaxID=1078050 RepID=UPI0026F07876|nr:DUF167 domain-containing protein [Seleniivibrio woodruffii]
MKLSVYVQPGAKKTEHSGMHDGRPKIRLNAPPVDGAANDELVKFVAKRLKLPKSSVKLVSGHASRLKTLEIDADEEDIMEVFGE